MGKISCDFSWKTCAEEEHTLRPGPDVPIEMDELVIKLKEDPMAEVGKSKVGKDVDRGSQDEFESLVLIVRENRILQKKVTDRIHFLRKFMNENVFEQAKRTHDQTVTQKAERNRKKA